jgi:LytS/YehU family sensor histidine kinase
MLAVLVLLVTTRMFDSFAWTPPSSPNRIKIILYDHLFQFFSFLPFIFLFIYTYNLAISKKLFYMLFLCIVLYTVAGPVLFLLLNTWIESLIWGGEVLPFTLDLVKKYSAGASIVLLFLSATYFITHLILQTDKQKESAHKAETLAKDVQLKMLRYQINPHFLFNVLNSIYTLIDENTEKAKKLVVDMSEYYRYTLNKHQQTIPIEKEVESILKYLEIQKTRFEEEFHYVISVDEASKSVSIPSFIIHLLIENAIKYGTKTMKQGLIVELSVKLVNNILLIRVANTGKLVTVNHSSESTGNGTSNGIENIKNRLSLYYNDSFSLSLHEENGWVIADIKIENIDAK